ncbi:MAG: DUF2062 domain-containing protein [Gammaproteobacteria bacterium]|nr:DUF2062 domain-containing protein [Gammaproteobacteria bacterium]
MPRKFFRRWVPGNRAEFNQRWYLRPFQALLHDPALWHFTRRATCKAFAVGVFCGFMPIPLQMALAAVIAIYLRINLPVAVATVWFTNPITIGPIFYFAYMVGSAVLSTPAQDIAFQLSFDWFNEEIKRIWKPLLTGSFILGTVGAALGYFILNFIWMQSALNRYRKRRFFKPRQPRA